MEVPVHQFHYIGFVRFSNNAITFNTLSNGTYDNCTVMVTDNALVIQAVTTPTLHQITTFFIVDRTSRWRF